MSSTSIKAENLGKAYQLGEIGTGTISRDLERWYARIRGKEDPFLRIGEVNDRASKGESNVVWSLKDINFEIGQGEAIGIIGRNGAGKSTLLKILSRVTSPTTGKITGKGRIASLLEVGTGFHPELTGRENIYLNGAILGMRKAEIKKHFDAIVDFAGIERYIDTPVKRYSSGMYVRLAFAVAAHLESEILVVDEVLAVGDAEFQKKCLGKMSEVSSGEGRTVLFVSHNMNSIAQFCNSSILMEQGRIKAMGKTNKIIGEYLSMNSSQTSVWRKITESYYHINFDIQEFGIVDENQQVLLNSFNENKNRAGIRIKFQVDELHSSLCYGIAVFNQNQDCLFWSYNSDTSTDNWPEINKGYNEVIVWLPVRFLNEGTYSIKLISSLHFIQWIISPEDAPFINLEIKGGLSDSPIWNDARPGILAPVLNFQKIV